jgi:hypothetical protein
VSLLRARSVEAARAAVARKRRRRQSALRRAMFGADGNAVPTGFVRLSDPKDQELWLKSLDKQARREQEGFAPGDVATRAIQSPIVREGAAQVQGAANVRPQ